MARASAPSEPRVFDLTAPPPLSPAELTALLGGKGANLAVMAATLGLPVPPGFTITTATCREYLAGGWPDGLDQELRDRMAGMEVRLGRRFGDADDPLLVSIRSGAPVSMPGMLDTILNIGLNAATLPGLAGTSGDPDFAADCARRLRAMYAGIVGGDAPEDPWAQLRSAIEAVFRSWNGARARAYRQREGISDELGTAVTVQAMVFGNRGPDSATGVLFTRNPATGERAPYGDVLFGAQGEDVVAGTHRTESIAILDERLPQVATELRRYADRLERHYADLCDIEFTIEAGRLWLLQVRVGKRSPRAALRMAVDMADEPGFPLTRQQAVRRVAPLLAAPPAVVMRGGGDEVPIAVGLAASPGIASGGIATSAEMAQERAATGRSVILVRSETSPEDVAGMASSRGVLTSRGGLASHAAVVARGWGIPAVVGAAAVEVTGDGIVAGGSRLPIGATITIDGSTGEVFAGDVVGTSSVAPEAAILLDWARDLAIPIGDASPVGVDGVAGGARRSAGAVAGEGPQPAGGSGPGEADLQELLLRSLLVKGTADIEALEPMLPAPRASLDPALQALASGGLAERAGEAWRLTAGGRLRAGKAFDADRGRLGEDQAAAALDRFQDLDRRVKQAVSDYQLRSVDGAEPVLNDHADAEYDGSVLERLREVDADAQAWLRELTRALPRLASYGIRLGHAVGLARAGDGRFVASPRVDSYHGVWFELHEDLIRVAGRTRAQEAAEGRA